MRPGICVRCLGLMLGVAIVYACGQTSVPPAPAASDWPLPQGLDDWVQVVPSAALPPEVEADLSNNNLDILIHGGRLYFVYRTGPTHFASPDVRMYVISSTDLTGSGGWEFELAIRRGRDVREPRLFAVGDNVHLVFSELGDELTAFEPGQVFQTVRTPDGTWSEPVTLFADGRIVWRVKTRNNRLWMSAYRGGERIYQEWNPQVPLEVMLLTSDDGWVWRPADPDYPVVLTGGVSETAFEFADNGDLLSVSRNEPGDHTGFGSRVCRADAAALGAWQCAPRSDPNKYDSPAMFRYGDRFYLIARYNPEGPYDLDPEAPLTFEHFIRNLHVYSRSTKRTALYGVDPETLTVTLLHVLPSNGDTAFASVQWIDEHRLLVFNYSSDFQAPDMAWIEGQLTAGAQIYRAIFDFSALP